MEFEWDPRKAELNRTKHGVAFADAVGAFEDELALTIADDHASEERFISLGCDFLGRVLVVVFCWRGETIRIISARKATRSERRQYEVRQ